MGADQEKLAANCANGRESKHSTISKWQLAIGQTLFTAKVAKAQRKKFPFSRIHELSALLPTAKS
jgi:hypothetical protein